VLAQAKRGLRVWVRKAHGFEHEAWLRAGIPRGAGLPPVKVLADQILSMEEQVQAWLDAERKAYVEYLKANPPEKAPIAKAALGDLPLETALTYHAWLEDVTLRRQTHNAATGSFEERQQTLQAILQSSLGEGVGTGGIAAGKAAGALAPGFSKLTQVQAKKLLKDIAPMVDADSIEARSLYAAVRARAEQTGINGAVLRDGAGRPIGAATWSSPDVRSLIIYQMGALDTAVPGSGLQLIRELAGQAAKKAQDLWANPQAGGDKVFTDLGFTVTPSGALRLSADDALTLARKVPDTGAAWTRVGFLEGPTGNLTTVDAGQAEAVAAETAEWDKGLRGELARDMARSAGKGSPNPVLALRGPEGKLLTLGQYAENPANLEVIGLASHLDAPPGAGRRMMREISSIAAGRGKGIKLEPAGGAVSFYERLGMTWDSPDKNFMRFTPEQTAAFASGLTAPSNFVGQISWELAVAGADEQLRFQTIKGVVDQVAAATHQELVNTLANSLARGENVDAIAARVENLDGAFGPARAQRIARTEVITANRAGAYQMGADAGCDSKKWMAQMGLRTRPWHRKTNGQQVAYDQPFKVANSKGAIQELMYPGDRSRGATADNLVNCRCSFNRIKTGVSDAVTLTKPDQHGTDSGRSAPAPVAARSV